MKNYQFFQNRECEYFPCHKGADAETFNCLFCYCPLYLLKEQCGGHYRCLENGIKDCTNCHIPHEEGGYAYIMKKMKLVMEKGNLKKEAANKD